MFTSFVSELHSFLADHAEHLPLWLIGYGCSLCCSQLSCPSIVFNQLGLPVPACWATAGRCSTCQACAACDFCCFQGSPQLLTNLSIVCNKVAVPAPTLQHHNQSGCSKSAKHNFQQLPFLSHLRVLRLGDLGTLQLVQQCLQEPEHHCGCVQPRCTATGRHAD